MLVLSALIVSAALQAAAPLEGVEGVESGEPRAPRRVDVKAFDWNVDTDPIVLGETEAVSVTLRAQQPGGAPLDVAPPILRASTGALSSPVRQGPGEWQTTFTPPSDRFPHVAILSAQVDEGESSTIGFLALPLWGKGRLQVKTKPQSAVVIYIGNKSFGPEQASAAGLAFVNILAPPGPERAVAHSKDLAGNESQKTVDLGVPPFNRVALVKIDEVAAADGTGEAQLLAFAVDKKGAPLFEAPLEASASVGGFEGEPLGLAPGVYRLRFRPGQAPKGTAVISARLRGSEASVAEATVGLLSGPAVRASLEASRQELSIDDDDMSLSVVVRLFDQADNAVPREGGRVDVSAGRIDAVDAVGEEAVRVRWILPSRLVEEPPTLTARATTGEVLGSLPVSVLPGAPAHLRLDPVAPVVADGQATATLRVRVTDRADNALLPEGLRFEWPAGEVLGPTVEGEHFMARLVPEVNDQESLVPVVARLGDLEATTQVRLLPRPRARLLMGAGVHSGWNYGSLFAAGPDLSLLVRLPGFDGGAHAGLSLGYLVALPSEVETPAGKLLTRAHSAVPLHLEAGWRPLITPRLSAHLGGALGVVLSDLSLGSERGPAQRSVTTAASAAVVAGMAFHLGPGLLEANLRVGWAHPLGSDLVGPPLGAGLVLAYRFGL